MTKPILIARVIKDKLAPKFFLNTTEEKRQYMLRTMVSTLIKEQRIKTTSAKAKFVQFYADRLVDLAKDGSPEAYEQAKSLVKDPDAVLPKLFGPMASRYRNTQETYTNVMLNGQRDYKKPTQGLMQYPDAAMMAILEYKNTSDSISYLLARRSIPAYTEQHEQIKQKLTDENQISLTFRELKHLNRKEQALQKSLKKFKDCVAEFDASWELERVHLEENKMFYQQKLANGEMNESILNDMGYVVENGQLSIRKPEELAEPVQKLDDSKQESLSSNSTDTFDSSLESSSQRTKPELEKKSLFGRLLSGLKR